VEDKDRWHSFFISDFINHTGGILRSVGITNGEIGMPFGKRKVPHSRKVQVINKVTGRVLGTHPSQKKANQQLAALAINYPQGFAKPKKSRRKK
jgi:hypothetical protein